MKELIDAWNELKEKEEVKKELEKMVNPRMIGVFLTIPGNVYEFSFSSDIGEVLTIKDTDPVIIQKTRYNEEPKEIDIDKVLVSINDVINKARGEKERLAKNDEISRMFIVLQNKDEQEFLITITTRQMKVISIKIDPEKGRVKESKVIDIFSGFSR